MYLRNDEFYPDELGFNNLDDSDLVGLFEELSIDGWTTALKVIERTFSALYSLAYGNPPDNAITSQLPKISVVVRRDIVDAIDRAGLFIQRQAKDQRIVSRTYLSTVTHIPIGRFTHIPVRKFLWGFEDVDGESSIMIPGRTANKFPRSNGVNIIGEGDPSPRSANGVAAEASYCRNFLLGRNMPSIGIPKLAFTSYSVKGLKTNLEAVEHRHLIPVAESLQALNEAACWITQYGDSLINMYQDYMTLYNSEYEQMSQYGYSDGHIRKSIKIKYPQLRNNWLEAEKKSCEDSGVVSNLGLAKAINSERRDVNRGDITLFQAIFSLVGACAYAIGMMKPMREGELAAIAFDCVVVHNRTNGCWVKFPVQKSEKQSIKRVVSRPIPYLTYLAIKLMQRLARATSHHLAGGIEPPRLFYFPSGGGFQLPVRSDVFLSINRCMDIFCDYLNLPITNFGDRRYFRVHEMRKFFLLMLTWDDRQHGWECGAWMAAHRDPAHMQAYTDANLDGVEITDWEAEQVEIKILELELAACIKPLKDDLLSLYDEARFELGVDKISGLPAANFTSFVRNALTSGRYAVKPLRFKSLGGIELIDFGVFITEVQDG
ncbi:hypothetical protein AO256_24785 [Pseudomonas syringae]|nr:hypothetical protein AO256_24785 [Pseudomonas syringae]